MNALDIFGKYYLISVVFHTLLAVFVVSVYTGGDNTSNSNTPVVIDLSMSTFVPVVPTQSKIPIRTQRAKSLVPVVSENRPVENDTEIINTEKFKSIAENIDTNYNSSDTVPHESTTYSGNIGPVAGGSEQIASSYINRQFSYIRKIIVSNLSYPYKARYRNQEGKLLVSFFIMLDGTVSDIKVVESSGFDILDINAVKTVKKSAPFPKPPCVAELKVPITYKLF